MSQRLRITRVRKKDGSQTKQMMVINKNSIGRIHTPWGWKEYNMHLLPTNVVDFDEPEKITNPSTTKRSIYIRRK